MNMIKKLRKENGLTLRELGKEIGIKDNTLSQYENSRRNLSQDNAIKLASFFGVSLDYLLGYSDERIDIDKLLDDAIKKDEKRTLEKMMSIYKNVGIEQTNAMIDLIDAFNYKNENDFKLINTFIRESGRIGITKTKKIISLMQDIKNK